MGNNFHARKELAEMLCDHLFQGHKASIAQGEEAAENGRYLHSGELLQLGGGVLH